MVIIPRKEQLGGNKQVNVLFSKEEYEILLGLGNPTEVFRQFIRDKMGEKQKVAQEIKKCKENIAKEQERLAHLEELYRRLEVQDIKIPERPNSNSKNAEVIQIRYKVIKNFVGMNISKLTGPNVSFIRDAGKFKDKEEALQWIKSLCDTHDIIKLDVMEGI